eukprot:gene1406-1601_t
MQYLLTRGKTLKRVVLVLDGRHGLKHADIQFFQQLCEYRDNPSAFLSEEVGEGNTSDLLEGTEFDVEKKDNRLEQSHRSDAFPQSEANPESRGGLSSPSTSTTRRRPVSTFPWKLQIVLTKCDLVDRLELARRISMLSDQLVNTTHFPIPVTLPIIPLSGMHLQGLIGLQKSLSALVVKAGVGAGGRVGAEEGVDTNREVRRSGRSSVEDRAQ